MLGNSKWHRSWPLQQITNCGNLRPHTQTKPSAMIETEHPHLSPNK